MSEQIDKLGAIQAEVDHWIQTVGVRYFNELTPIWLSLLKK